MAPIFVRLRKDAPAKPVFQYRLAGRPLLSDEPLGILGLASPPAPELESYLSTSRESHLEKDLAILEVFRGEAFIGGDTRFATGRFQGEVGWIEIEGIGEFQLTPEGVTLLRLDTRNREALEYSILGPLLLLVLAQRGVFCLHSSAVLRSTAATQDEELDLFVGISGAGKSTLAAQLHDLGWRQTADDLLPLILDQDQLFGLPDFPQPKRPDRTLPRPTPVRSIHVLDEGESPSLDHLSGLEATVSLVRHTAGSRFFPREILERHMATMANWARSTPVRRLAYPRRMDVFPAVADLLNSASAEG